MSASAQIRRMGKFVTVLLIINLCFWIYFAISFAQASYPFKRDPWGHPAGAGYTFLGHSIGVVESPLAHPFYRVMVWVEFPSFVLVRLGQNVFFPRFNDQFFAGISDGGWRLIAVLSLSFLQWYLVGWAVQTLWRRATELRWNSKRSKSQAPSAQ